MNRQVIDSRFRLDPGLHFARPELVTLLTLWRDSLAGRTLPDRDDFSPFVLRPYLPRILIYEASGDPPQRRFRFRLYGTLVSKYSGRDATGKFLDEMIHPEAYADFHTGLSWIADHRLPMRATGTYYFVDRSFVHFESISMPITVSGGDKVDQIISVTYYGDED